MCQYIIKKRSCMGSTREKPRAHTAPFLIKIVSGPISKDTSLPYKCTLFSHKKTGTLFSHKSLHFLDDHTLHTLFCDFFNLAISTSLSPPHHLYLAIHSLLQVDSLSLDQPPPTQHPCPPLQPPPPDTVLSLQQTARSSGWSLMFNGIRPVLLING